QRAATLAILPEEKLFSDATEVVMRIALGLPSRIAGASGELMLEWAVRAEGGPFSSIVVTDRVVSQALEPLSVLAMAAGATRRIGLMTSVVIGPTRETTLLARQAATLDVLSNGRLTLGVGIGVRKNDYDASGFDFHRRGRRGRADPSCSSAATCRRSSGASRAGATATWRRAAANRRACSRCGTRSSRRGAPRGGRENRAGSAPATSPWGRRPPSMRRDTSTPTTVTIPTSRPSACARCPHL